jgi:hypothetical protein
MKYLIVITAIALSGCASRTVVAPSTAASTAQIHQAQTQNVQIGSNLDRAERKNVLTKRWMELHYPQ